MSATHDRDRGDPQVTRDRIVATLEAIPYARHLGIRLAEAETADDAVFHLPFDARLIGNVTLPAIHGGVVATFMQAAALVATYALMHEDLPPKLVDFSIDYLSRPCKFAFHGQAIAMAARADGAGMVTNSVATANSDAVALAQTLAKAATLFRAHRTSSNGT